MDFAWVDPRMSSHTLPPLSEIAAGAQAHGRDLIAGARPNSTLCGALLLAQIDLVVGRRSDEAPTELLLGLIPLVDAATRARAADRLGPDAPSDVLAALRLHRGVTEPAVDEVAPLQGHRLAALVEEGRHDAELARWLLGHTEPTIQDRAALYRFATSAERASIRAALADRLQTVSVSVGALTAAERTDLVVRRSPAGLARWMANAGLGPSLGAVEGGLADPAEQELFALALLALGFSPDESIRVLLAQPSALSHSVAAIYALARLMRTTPVLVARHIADPDDRLVGLARSLRSEPASGATGEARPTSQRRPRGVNLDRARPRPEASALPDRRSTATTGLHRT